jgi:hypothetical protein
MLEWVRAMIAVTLGVKVNDELPPVYIQEATDNAWEQISESPVQDKHLLKAIPGIKLYRACLVSML